MREYDAVVIGAGHNGLAASIVLASAGWSVLVLERNASPGGAVRTEEVTLPGFRHDLFATNMNLFAGSPFHAQFGDQLAAHGLEFAATENPFGSVFPDGSSIGVSSDQATMAKNLEQVSESDRTAWTGLAARFESIAEHIFPLLGSSFPSAASARALVGGSRRLGRTWPYDLARLSFQSSRQFTEEHFSSRELQALVASWGMHLDLPPDLPGGALFSFLETFASHANGMVLGVGGAKNVIDALVRVLESHGGELALASDVARVELADGKAVGVELVSGEKVSASKAVVANLTPKVLFGPLVPGSALPEAFLQQVDAYTHAPGGLMIHLAMDDLPDWSAGQHVRNWAYVHIGPYMEDMTLAYQRAVGGLLPEAPTLVVGQPTAIDPTRAPDGKHVLWIQVRLVPSKIRGDAADEITDTGWETAKEAYADRVMGILDSYAPGITQNILGRTVLSPDDLESYNPNLIGGDSLGGSHQPMQFAGLRPFPGWTKYETPISHLYMVGASTWPGAGVGAGSGYLLGKKLTRSRFKIPGMS